MGGGGVSGAVTFPAYLQDVHGLILAGSETDSNDGTFVGAISTPIHNMVSLLNKAWEQDPFADFFFTDPEGLFDEVAARYEEFDGALEDLAPSNYTSLITKAVFAVTGASSVIDDLSVSLATSAPSTPQTLFANFATTARTEIAKFLAAANTSVSTNISALLASAGSSSLNGTSLVAATTLWKSLVSAATATLGACDFPKEVSVPAIINMAAANAKDNLKSALKVVEQIISGSIVDDLVTAFQTRRETAYEQEVAQFAGGMADINAVNSSAFLFGVALLRSEQQRSVAEFDAQINFQVLQQGLSNYISLHSAQLQVSAQAAIANTEAHNRLLAATIELLSNLNAREEITPTQLLSLYNGLFNAELSAYAGLAQVGLGNQNQLYGHNIQRDQVNHSLNLEADRINKVVKEQRYQLGLQQVTGILTNRLEFERAATALLTEQARVRTVAIREYESDELDRSKEDALWEIEVANEVIKALSAPAGMTAAVPKRPSAARSVIGGALQGAAAGGSIGGPWGAAGGALLGAGAGLASAL